MNGDDDLGEEDLDMGRFVRKMCGCMWCLLDLFDFIELFMILLGDGCLVDVLESGLFCGGVLVMDWLFG